MAETIDPSIVRTFRDRRSLLWVCQRYDLSPMEEPHAYDLPETEAILRYRPESNQTDADIASLYWEAIWLEGARSPLLVSLRQAAQEQQRTGKRAIVVLSSDSDAHAQLSSREFLPISVLPGLADPQATPDARYGSTNRRSRERVAWSLAQRLATLPGRVLLVLGAKRQSDLDRLYEVIEDSPIVDLRLLVSWDSDQVAPSPPNNPAVIFQYFQSSISQLINVLRTAGAPGAGELPKWAVRIGNRAIELSAADVHRVLDRFILLTEGDLVPPSEFTIEDLHDFLAGSNHTWKAFGAGLPVPRSYTVDGNLSLDSAVHKELNLLSDDSNGRMTSVVTLPSQGGSGATTLIRHVAYSCAVDGYPTLILRPQQVDIDLEELLAFATSLFEAAFKNSITDVPPILIVLDVEHQRLPGSREIHQALASHGRKAVVLKAASWDAATTDEGAPRRRNRFEPLHAISQAGEVEACEVAFRDLVKRWNLPIDVPSLRDWREYATVTEWETPGGKDTNASMFWVALRYFITEGMPLSEARRAQDALGSWVAKRRSAVTDEGMQKVISYVAALSTVRILSPLWTVLRPVTGGSFTSELVTTIKQLKDVVDWGEFASELEDHVLRFSHPILADEYLRQQGIVGRSEQLRMLIPMLRELSQGRPGDVWVAESLAATITPSYSERESADWNWRLELFESLPPTVRANSKAVLHHWARCLYLSADISEPLLPTETRRERFQSAIANLIRAAELPRRLGRDEHPSHIYNTLGTAYSRYARFLKDTGNLEKEESKAWEDACRAFDQSIALSGAGNIEAFLAFSDRLIRHSGTADDGIPNYTQVRDLTYALLLLDTAEDLLREYESTDEEWGVQIQTFRAQALSRLNSEACRSFIEELKSSDESELGYHVEARLCLQDSDEICGIERAIDILEAAEENGIAMGVGNTSFMISLLMKHPIKQYDFIHLRHLFQRLEALPGYIPRVLDVFRHAVLCYQVGEFSEGSDRFRRLREQTRRSGTAPVRLRGIWLDQGDPTRPRQTQIRVTRVITEWRAEGYVSEFRQSVPLRPRHFSPPPSQNEVVTCIIRFEVNGPLAVPPRFEERLDSRSSRRRNR